MRAIDKERLRKAHEGEYHMGRRVADRLHVGLTNLQVLRAAWQQISHNRANLRPELRSARKALYLGAIEGHRDNINLYTRVQRGRI